MTVTAFPEAGPDRATEIFASFALAVRSAGVPVTLDRSQAFLRATSLVGAEHRAAVYWAGRATLCANPDDIERYDLVFSTWFSGELPAGRAPRESTLKRREADLGGDGGGDADGGDVMHVHATASATEVLRHRDVAELSRAERAELARLFAQLHPQPPSRLSARRRPARRGEVDGRRTLREQLRHAGEPATLEFRRRTQRQRRVVVLVDVSGSMGPYADSLLRWAHALTGAAPGHVETFTIGTRLTRVTRALRARDGETALQLAGQTVPDWSGGTRLGEALQVFLDRWGQRGLARGAVVVIMSDGWERGEATLLREQMQRLHRLAHCVVWVNPHQGKVGYAPVQGGIVAALPYVDHFIAGHSIATFEQALEVVADA